jgi:hypothetical protein
VRLADVLVEVLGVDVPAALAAGRRFLITAVAE